MTIPASGPVTTFLLNQEIGRPATNTLSFADGTLANLRGTTSHPALASQFLGKTRFVMFAGTWSVNGTTIGYMNPASYSPSTGSMTPSADGRYSINALTGPAGGHSSLNLILYGVLPQSNFTTLRIDGTVYTSASAGYFLGSNTTQWSWAINPDFNNGQMYTIYIN
jgi:hypothetical protein